MSLLEFMLDYSPMRCRGASFVAFQQLFSSFSAAFQQVFTNILGPQLGLLASVGVAYLVGLAYGLATDKMLERPAGKWSVAAGTLAALSVGLLVHWAVGVAVGSVVGSITGALIERRVMKEPKRMRQSRRNRSRNRLEMTWKYNQEWLV